ncbi:Hypothetical predicted protein [Cloeon dipterum]|uniref:Uncharacterized protein n=1 Tax=Cloeon dipterum TaxID=197152 RepID=A0A8S1DAT6_9INSE|nr:Hypothetical predicted protein [Cloeon dipterum]
MEESDPESSLESDSNQERQKVPDSPYYFGQTNSTLIPDRVRLKNLSKEIDAMLKTLAKMKKELKVKRNRRRRAGPSQKVIKFYRYVFYHVFNSAEQKIETKKRKIENRKELLDHRPNKITRQPKKIPVPKNANERRYRMRQT